MTRTLSVLIPLISAVAVATGGASPTGSTATDLVLVSVASACVVALADVAPWWTVLLAAGAALALAAGAVGVVCGVGALALAVRAAVRPNPLTVQLGTGLAMVGLSRLSSPGFLGLSTIVAVVATGVVVIPSLARSSRRVRRWHLVAVGTIAAFGVLSLIGLGFSALSARGDLRAANELAHKGVAALKNGDFEQGRGYFAAANERFQSANDALSAPWTWPSAVIPVAAQYRELGVDLTASAVRITRTVESAVSLIDPDSLKISGGAIDLDAVRALQRPLADVHSSIEALSAELTKPRSQWIATQVIDKLDEVSVDFAKYDQEASNASLAAELAPELLGATSPRHYFVAFTTPAESRGLGGFMGNYAILDIDAGAISLSHFGRSDDLVAAAAANPEGVTLSGLDDFLGRYGRFNFADPRTGQVQPIAWKNVTVSPDMATVSKVITQMYAQSGGSQVDGVIVMDPYVLASLLRYTGPITVSGAPYPLTADNTVDFILRSQYLIEQKDERVDLLADVAKQTLDRILGGALPAPAQLAKDLGAFTRDDRLMVWVSNEQDEALLRRLNMSGHFPQTPKQGSFAVSVDNAGGNKIDAYLKMSVTCSTAFDTSTKLSTDVVEVSLENTAPAAGLPDYVLRNTRGLPRGTNVLFLSVYSEQAVAMATRDGAAMSVEVGDELGWKTASNFVALAAETRSTVRFTYISPGRRSGCTVHVPPLAIVS